MPKLSAGITKGMGKLSVWSTTALMAVELRSRPNKVLITT